VTKPRLFTPSNIGSFLALLSYPVLLEPMLSLRMQNLLWTSGYGLLIVLIAGCGVLLLRAPPCQTVESATGGAAAPAVNWAARGRWIFLAAVPSGLLIAVSAHISTDVAAAPLLWVLPLSILLTWVLVFQARPLLPHRWMLLLQPLAIVCIIVLLSGGSEQNLFVLLGGGIYFASSSSRWPVMVNWRELDRRRSTSRASMSRCRSAAWWAACLPV
jgi:hypothetical protein